MKDFKRQFVIFTINLKISDGPSRPTVNRQMTPEGIATHRLRTAAIIVIAVPPLSFIHSFIPAIYIAPLQVLYYSEALPTTARILYRSFTPKRTGNCR